MGTFTGAYAMPRLRRKHAQALLRSFTIIHLPGPTPCYRDTVNTLTGSRALLWRSSRALTAAPPTPFSLTRFFGDRVKSDFQITSKQSKNYKFFRLLAKKIGEWAANVIYCKIRDMCHWYNSADTGREFMEFTEKYIKKRGYSLQIPKFRDMRI
jgi:hypothetical protein